MTKRDFFRVIFKLFALYWLVMTLFTVIPHNISNLIIQPSLEIGLLVLSLTALSIGLFLLLLLRADKLVALLRLDRGFDEDRIDFGQWNNQSLLKLAVILIGGFLLVENIGDLLFYTVNYFKYKGTSFAIEGTTVNYAGISVAAINVVVGYLFLANYGPIARFLDK